LRKQELNLKNELLWFVEQVLGYRVKALENGFELSPVLDKSSVFKFNTESHDMNDSGHSESNKKLFIDYEQVKHNLPEFLSKKLDNNKELTSSLSSIFALYSLNLVSESKNSGEKFSDSEIILTKLRSDINNQNLLKEIISEAFGFDVTCSQNSSTIKLKSKFSKRQDDFVNFKTDENNNKLTFEVNGILKIKYNYRLCDIKNKNRLAEVLMNYQTQLLRNLKPNGGFAVNRYADFLEGENSSSNFSECDENEVQNIKQFAIEKVQESLKQLNKDIQELVSEN